MGSMEFSDWRKRLKPIPMRELEPEPQDIIELSQRVRELQKLLSSRKEQRKAQTRYVHLL